MKRISYILVLIFGVISCEPTDAVKFESPQPESTKARSEFRTKIQGQYVNFSNPDKVLTIHNHLITTKTNIRFSCQRSEIELDSNVIFDLNNDEELIQYLNQDGGTTSIINDSIFYLQHALDTLFAIDKDHILKKYKSSYFLNYKYADNYWRVKKLTINKDTLLIGEITPGDTLLSFDYVEKEVEYVKSDSALVEIESEKYILSPSKKEFKKLLRSEAFETTEKYIKQRSDRINE